MILAGDIGGTKTLLLLGEMDAGKLHTVREERYENAAFPSFEQILSKFLQDDARPATACFAVAGPIEGRCAKLTNLPWQVDADTLSTRFGFEAVELINDFVAVGYGIDALGVQDLVTLQAGQPRVLAPRAVLGAGTGLGECLLVWTGKYYEVIASEGGHVDFAPSDEAQLALWHQLRQQYGHVSYERVLSGAGLVAIYQSLRQGEADGREITDPAAISQAALDGHALARRALDMFLQIYGAQAGNLALTCLARGGVYVAGGIAPQLIELIKNGGFLRAFLDKGRHSRLVAEMPLHVVMNPKVGLLGAALRASRLSST